MYKRQVYTCLSTDIINHEFGHAVLDGIRPAVEPLFGRDRDHEALVHEAVRANVLASARRLRDSEILRQTDGLRVVSAEYSLATGVVDFFDGVP